MPQENVVPFRRKKQKSKSNKAFVGLLLTFGMLALFAYYLASPLAKVAAVEIRGNSNLQADEILEIAGLQEGMHLWRINLKACRDKLLGNQWVLEAQIERKFPNTISISLSERVGVAIISSNNGNWVVATDKVVLTENNGFSLPWLTGLDLAGLAPGTDLEGQVPDIAFTWATEIQPFAWQVSEINLDSYPSFISVFTVDGYKIIFDPSAVPHEKIQDCVILLEELRRNKKKGIIDFRGMDGRGVFIPWPGNSPGQ